MGQRAQCPIMRIWVKLHQRFPITKLNDCLGDIQVGFQVGSVVGMLYGWIVQPLVLQNWSSDWPSCLFKPSIKEMSCLIYLSIHNMNVVFPVCYSAYWETFTLYIFPQTGHFVIPQEQEQCLLVMGNEMELVWAFQAFLGHSPCNKILDIYVLFTC